MTRKPLSEVLLALTEAFRMAEHAQGVTAISQGVISLDTAMSRAVDPDHGGLYQDDVMLLVMLHALAARVEMRLLDQARVATNDFAADEDFFGSAVASGAETQRCLVDITNDIWELGVDIARALRLTEATDGPMFSGEALDADVTKHTAPGPQELN